MASCALPASRYLAWLLEAPGRAPRRTAGAGSGTTRATPSPAPTRTTSTSRPLACRSRPQDPTPTLLLVTNSTYIGAATTLRSDVLLQGPMNPDVVVRLSLSGRSSVLGIGTGATLYVTKLVRRGEVGRGSGGRWAGQEGWCAGRDLGAG